MNVVVEYGLASGGDWRVGDFDGQEQVGAEPYGSLEFRKLIRRAMDWAVEHVLLGSDWAAVRYGDQDWEELTCENAHTAYTISRAELNANYRHAVLERTLFSRLNCLK